MLEKTGETGDSGESGDFCESMRFVFLKSSGETSLMKKYREAFNSKSGRRWLELLIVMAPVVF